MKIHLKKADIKQLGIILFMFFFLTVDFRSSIFFNVGIAYCFAFFSLMLIFYGTKTRITTHIPITVLAWLISSAFVMTSGNASLIIKYILGLMILYTFATTNGAGGNTVKVMMIYGMVFSLASFWFYLFPSIYINGIVPLLEDYLQSSAITMIRSNRYPGLTGHYSTNGIYLSFGVGAAFATYLSNHDGYWRKISIIATIIGFLALLLIGKRAHLVFSAGACFVIYWIANNKRGIARIGKVFGVVIAILVLVVIAVNQVPALANTFNRFVETAASGDFLMSRGGFYLVAIDIFKRNPLFGVGWRKMTQLIRHDVHNIYIQLLAENGIVGFLFFTVILIYGLMISTKEFNWASKNRELLSKNDYSLLAFATFYMYFFTMYGFTGNPLYDEQTFYVLMVSYGACIYYHYINRYIRKNMMNYVE